MSIRGTHFLFARMTSSQIATRRPVPNTLNKYRHSLNGELLDYRNTQRAKLACPKPALSRRRLVARIMLRGVMIVAVASREATTMSNERLPTKTGTPDQTFQRALVFHKDGRLEAADRLYRAVLAADHRHFNALLYLSVLRLQQDDGQEAAALIRRALAENPESAEAHANLASVLQTSGRDDEAIACYGRALALNPAFPEVSYGLAATYHALRRYEDAISHYEAALALDPDYAEASCGLATVLQAQARHDEAVANYQNALAVDPHYSEANRGLAITLHALKRHDEAIAHYHAALAVEPDHAETLNNLGNALQAQKRCGEAIACYERAVAIKPDFATAYHNLGNAHQALEQHDKAVASYWKALAAAPDIVQSHISCAAALQALNRHEEAICHCEKALAIAPSSSAAHNNLGRVLLEVGRIDEASRAFEKAIEIAPRTTGLYVNLFSCRNITVGDPHLAALEALAGDQGSLTEDERIALNFALGKAYSDIGQQERSFRHLLDGNALKRRQIIYDEAAVLRWFDDARRVCTPAVIRERQNLGDPSSIPVFLVGMMRSGGTLVEQILASHPQVFAAGERKDFAKAVKALGMDGSAAPNGGVGSPLDGERLRRLGAIYLSGLTALAPAAEKIIDKMPANLRFLGLIHLAMPNARIVHTCRDPIDTCLSCFSKLFTDEQPFTYDLGELGRYYRAYQKLMEHWRHALPPGVMLDVQYERLVTDFEEQARQIVTHCGLAWDDRCLSFYETQRPVKTASVVQVRQPVYRSSVGRWRPNRDLLQPLLEALGASE